MTKAVLNYVSLYVTNGKDFIEKKMLKTDFPGLNCIIAVVALYIGRRQYFH